VVRALVLFVGGVVALVLSGTDAATAARSEYRLPRAALHHRALLAAWLGF
jgi:uncharacterized membrane protein YsdA (DUF1294 family)